MPLPLHVEQFGILEKKMPLRWWWCTVNEMEFGGLSLEGLFNMLDRSSSADCKAVREHQMVAKFCSQLRIRQLFPSKQNILPRPLTIAPTLCDTKCQLRIAQYQSDVDSHHWRQNLNSYPVCYGGPLLMQQRHFNLSSL